MSNAYTIQRGDTLGKIAKRYGTTVAELATLNNISNPHKIKAGASLNLPGATTVSAPSPTPTLAPATPTIGSHQDEITSILAQLKELNSTPLPSYATLSLDDAKSQASSQFKSQYDELQRATKGQLDLDAERRGIFNSPLAADMMMQKESQIRGAYDTDVANLAKSLMDTSLNQSLARQQQDIDARNQSVNRLTTLLSALQQERGYADSQSQSSSRGGSSGGSISSGPMSEQQMQYQASERWLNDILGGKYTSQKQLGDAMYSWLDTVGKTLGGDVKNYMFNAVKDKYNSLYSSLGKKTTTTTTKTSTPSGFIRTPITRR